MFLTTGLHILSKLHTGHCTTLYLLHLIPLDKADLHFVYIFCTQTSYIAQLLIHFSMDSYYICRTYLLCAMVLQMAAQILHCLGPPPVLGDAPLLHVPSEEAASYGSTCAGLILTCALCVY